MEEQVNIPALLIVFDGVTWFMTSDEIWLCSSVASRATIGKSVVTNSNVAGSFG